MMINDVNPCVESNFSWAEWTPNTTLKLCRVPVGMLRIVILCGLVSRENTAGMV